MSKIQEVQLNGNKIYISKHDAFTLAIQDGDVKRKFKFEKGRLEVTDPKDTALIDNEYERRYLVKDANGDPVLDAKGENTYGGEMLFVPIDQYEKSRLYSPVLVKTKSGKTYKVTEADLIEIAEKMEASETKHSSKDPEDAKSDLPKTNKTKK